MVTQVLADYNNQKDNKYINISIYDNLEVAPVALMVTHQSHKLGLSRLSGSIPGCGASAFLDEGNRKL